MKSDYYGNGIKWFVGVVKDIADPLASNRVRVRIKGIHPEDTAGDGGDNGSDGTGSIPFSPNGEATTGGGFGGEGFTTGGGFSSQNDPSADTKSMAAVDVDTANLPNARQLTAKISKHFTLGDLTSGPRLSHDVSQHMAKLTPEIIENLSRLALNALDPIKERFPGMVINSGWRPFGRQGSNTKNHGLGIAADIQVPGVTFSDLYDWIRLNLKGRYNFLYNELNHVHIQLGSQAGKNQGTVDNPVNRVLRR